MVKFYIAESISIVAMKQVAGSYSEKVGQADGSAGVPVLREEVVETVEHRCESLVRRHLENPPEIYETNGARYQKTTFNWTTLQDELKLNKNQRIIAAKSLNDNGTFIVEPASGPNAKIWVREGSR